MRKCPKIGDRVKLKVGHRYGELVGRIYAIYKTHDDRYDEAIDEVIPGPLRIEATWHVGFEVEGSLPSNWAYIGGNRFAPEVGELEKC